MVETREVRVQCSRFRRAVVGESQGLDAYKPASGNVEKSIDEHNDSLPLTIVPRPAYQRQKTEALISCKSRFTTRYASQVRLLVSRAVGFGARCLRPKQDQGRCSSVGVFYPGVR